MSFKVDSQIALPYPIQSGVAMPGIRRQSRTAYPFDQMQPGDSFPLPDEPSRNRASAAASDYTKKNPGQIFTTRRVADGYRLWRIA